MKKKLLLALVVSSLLAGCNSTSVTNNIQETEMQQIQDIKEQEKTHNHTYIDAITTEATCESDGIKTFSCECGDSYTEVIAAIGHNYEEVADSAVEATCDTEGKKADAKCTICEDITEGEKIPATGHNYEEVADSAVEASCDAEGKEKDTKCTICESVIEGEKIPALDHSYGEYVYNNDATTSADGTETAVCLVCNEKSTRTKVGTKIPLESFPYQINVLYNDGKVGYFYCVYDEYVAAFGDGFHDTVIGKLCDAASMTTSENMRKYDSSIISLDNNTFPAGYDKDVYVGEYAEGTIWKYTAYIRYKYPNSEEIYVWH